MIEKSQQVNISYNASITLNYLLWLPDGYSKQDDWPIILYLHGAGERGDDIDLVRLHDIPKGMPERNGFPFVVLAPQCPENHWWSDFLPALMKLLEMTVEQYNIDPDRIYLTGLSMGGFGTWHMATEYPDTFAAIAPICGGGWFAHGFPERAAVLKDTPIWAFHGGKDQTVSVEASEVMVDTIKAAGSENVKLTIYPDLEHDSWTPTYNNPMLYAWFLMHRLSERLSEE